MRTHRAPTMPCCFATRRTLAQVRAGRVEATNSSVVEVAPFRSVVAEVISSPLALGEHQFLCNYQGRDTQSNQILNLLHYQSKSWIL
ncbi:MAG: hypothetical protein [Circular genetic element sp.]|nr:MAG: hypothetical protein [Circular genetic element sp.]